MFPSSPFPNSSLAYSFSEEHLCHELAAFFCSAVALRKYIEQKNNDNHTKKLQLMAFTTYYVKLRLLYDFLFPPEIEDHETRKNLEKKKPVYAHHYYKDIDSWNQSYIAKYPKKKFQEAIERFRVNVEIVHLSFDRKAFEENKHWNEPMSIASDFLQILFTFHLDADEIALNKSAIIKILNEAKTDIENIMNQGVVLKIGSDQVIGTNVAAQTMTVSNVSTESIISGQNPDD